MYKNKYFLRVVSLFLLTVFVVSFLSSCGGKSEKAQDKTDKTNQVVNQMQVACPELGVVPVCNRTQQVQAALLEKLEESDCNKITAEQLSNINILHLDKKEITNFQVGDFTGLTKLEELVIRHNPQLRNLPACLFQSLAFLEDIDLSYNQLVSLPTGVFQGQIYLGGINLEHNQLSNLPTGLFQGFTSLNVLDLGHNQLASLPVDMFQGIIRIGSLYLSHNHLNSLPPGIFQSVQHIGFFSIHANMLSDEEKKRIENKYGPIARKIIH